MYEVPTDLQIEEQYMYAALKYADGQSVHFGKLARITTALIGDAIRNGVEQVTFHAATAEIQLAMNQIR